MSASKFGCKFLSFFLVLTIMIISVPNVFADSVPANKSLYFTDFVYECTVIAPAVAWYFGHYSTVSISNDSYDGDGYAIQVTGDRSYAFAGTSLYIDTGIYRQLAPGKNYVLTAMMKVLPYNDGTDEYPVTLSTQVMYTINEYGFGNSICSDDGYQRVFIPFTTKEDYSNENVGYGDFYFITRAYDVTLNNGQTVNNVATFLLDDFELYEVYPPQITSSSITEGSQNVAVTTNGITFGFNNEMDDTTVLDAANYSLTGNSINSVTKNADGTYFAQFSDPLDEYTDYTLTVSNLKDSLNQSMDSFSISFKTKFADLPDISGTVPADGSINVPIDTSMVVTFDNDMDLSTINTDNITVNGDNSLISSITTNAAQPRQAIINFQNLDYVTLYNVKFSGIKSKSGRTIADRTVSFVTAVEEEIVYYNGFNDTSDLSWPKWSAGPIITSLNTDTAVSAPSSGYLVPPYDAGEMWFGQEGSAPLVPGEVYTISLWMKSSSDTNNGLYMVKSDESAFVFNIPKLNTEWTYYTSTFTATSIPMPFFRSKDTVPFFVDDLKVIKYPETVVLPNSTITDGAENVAINGPYTLVFSNNVDTASLTGNNIKINGQNVVITGTSSNTVTFNPGSPLSNSSVCTLSVNITDANNKAVIYSATFETAERFITSGIKVYRDYQGATQADVTNGALTNGKYTAVLSQLTNNATGPAEAALIAVLYKDSEMVDASYSRVHLNSGESILNPLTASIDLPASLSDGIYTYKAFLWNGLGDITPVIKNIVINE